MKEITSKMKRKRVEKAIVQQPGAQSYAHFFAGIKGVHWTLSVEP